MKLRSQAGGGKSRRCLHSHQYGAEWLLGKLAGGLFLVSLVLVPRVAASAADVYLGPTAGGAGDGSSCANARVYTYFNSGANWGAGATQIGPGTKAHVCGTIPLGVNGGPAFTFQGSGTSGNVVTLLFETGAQITSPAMAAGVQLNGQSFVKVDGGTNGTITNTANGTGQANTLDGTVGLQAGTTQNCGHDIEITNLSITNLYVRVQGTSGATGGGSGDIDMENCGNNILIHNNTLTHAHANIFMTPGAGTSTGWQIYSNTLFGSVWQLAPVTGTNGHGISQMGIHDNDMSGGNLWEEPGDAFHKDELFIFADGGGTVDHVKIYNNTFHGTCGPAFCTAMMYINDRTTFFDIFNNVFHLEGGGTTNGAITYGYGAANFRILNNTFVGFSTSTFVPIGDTGSPGDTSILIQNNIFSTWQGALYLPSTAAGQLSSNNNDWFNLPGNGLGSTWSVGGTIGGNTLAQWKTSSGLDGASIGTNPNLDASFRPLAGSPVIATGANLTSLGITELNTDKAGVLRPTSTNWDMGAFQAAGVGLSNNPSSISFPNQQTGTSSAAQAVVVTNLGASTVTSITCAVTGTNANQFSITDPANCLTSLGSSSSFTIHVQFSPTAAQANTANLTVNFSGGSSSTSLSGTGIGASAVVLSLTSSSACGNSNLSVQVTCPILTLTNNGSATATLSSIVISGPAATSFGNSTTCGATLNAAASCTITPTMTPLAAGSLSATLTVTDTPDNQTAVAALSGTGIDPNAPTLLHVTACAGQAFTPSASCTIPATTSGDLVVVGIITQFNYAPTVLSITGTGVTCTEAGSARSIDTNTNSIADISGCSTTGGTTVLTITMSGNGNAAAVIWEFTKATQADQTSVLNSQPASASPTGAGVTIASSSEVIISLLNPQNSISGIHAGNACTNDSLVYSAGWAHLITSSTGTFSCQWDGSNGTFNSSTATFRIPAGAVNTPGGVSISGALLNGFVSH